MRLFLDMDGVFADFEGAFRTIFGVGCREVSDEELWKLVNTRPTFFYDLPLMPGALEFYNNVREYAPIFLTACPRTGYADVAEQKKAWIRKHVCKDALILPIMGSHNKHLFIQDAGDVLIDDYHKNIKRWNDAGGIGITHHGDWTGTAIAFCARMNPHRTN